MKPKVLNQNDLFQSKDLPLCATLRYFGCVIESINRQNPAKAIFSFKRDKQLDNLIQQYWAHQLLVEPVAFFNCLKECKSRIYQQ